MEDELSLSDLPLAANSSPASPKRLRNRLSGKDVFQAVAIPSQTHNNLARRQNMSRVPSQTPMSDSSALSSVRDSSNEYETPGTSTAVTPAESLAKGTRPLRTLRSKANNTSLLSQASTSVKRKRTDKDELLEADALLAQALQDEEYAEQGTSPQLSRRDRRNLIVDSEDEADLSTFPKEEASSEDESLAPKRVRRSNRTSLPTRSARRNTKASIKHKGNNQMPDSDESEVSEFSEFRSDSDSEDESADGDVTASNSSSRAASVAATAANSAQRPHRPRRRPAPTGNGAGGWRARRTAAAFADRATAERAKLEKAHPEIKTMWTTLKDVSPIQPVEAKQPDHITRRLKPFQLEGLDWMIKQENSQWKGGLLGDEMGMGKTIQAVSLIMSDYPAKDPTLVVVPPVALMQWQNEISEYTNGLLKVLVYHNTNPKVKNLKIKELRSYDVIMISYSGLESIYRKESKGWKRDDGIVKENSKIHAMNYHRLILDEAHNIKTRTTGVAKACFALQADHRWCLSGTPVQNRIGEFFSLLRFLQIQPFACYFCKACPCAELHWSQNDNKKCSKCDHSGFNHVSIFNQELLNPIQGNDLEMRREALGKLRLITDRIMLRRMKRDHTASMELPPKEVVIHKEFFGEIERDFSKSIMSNTTRQFDTYVSRGVMLNNYANIFGLIMQMRQVANHPDLILKKHSEGGQNVLVCSVCDDTAEEPIRSRCHHEFCRSCAKQLLAASEDADCPRCHIPLTIDFEQPDIEQDEDQVKKNSIINRIKMEDWTSSTKIEMLVYDLYKLRSRKQTHKSIVFSQFTSMLQLVEWRLRRAGFNTVMLDGSMSPTQRQKSIEYFMNNTDVEVFLVSLKAGGVALNLTEASRVFIVDPWWNPAAEWQSADRCHRIGQQRPCVITRLCIEDSVESRMVLLQEKKANMINGTVNNDQVALEKLTPEDMQFLFRGS
ncbi:MAG: hypothetical protein LQ351_000334 [Letrouitia transgressa]|nr:MAG: hypothetical protein LQ351_000334 [Letrouitia transgressa]